MKNNKIRQIDKYPIVEKIMNDLKKLEKEAFKYTIFYCPIYKKASNV